jgi:cytochrome c oxidase subunit II
VSVIAVASDTRSTYDALAEIYLWVAAVVFAIIAVVIVWILVRHRGGRAAPRGPVDAPRTESLYAAGLVVVAAVLIVITFTSLDKVTGLTTAAAEDPRALRVDVIGAQWQWRFRYPASRPGQRVVEQTAPEGTPPELVVPVGREVLFSGISQDVLHDFWIPDLKFQRQVWPDHTERWALIFPHAGRYVGVCAWFCGLFHQNMHFVAVALAPAAFDRWLAGRRQAASA